MKKTRNNNRTPFFHYFLAGVIVITVTPGMLAASQFILTGRIEIYSYTLIG